MTQLALDQSAAIARYWCETPIKDLAAGGELTTRNVATETALRFPNATVEEFTRACAIANELMEADRRQSVNENRINNPCECGAPAEIVEVRSEQDPKPTGRRFCIACDLIEAAKVPCSRCGGPMNGEDVRAGVTLCEFCDPDEIGWCDDDQGAA